jgi:hypothetical protein
VGAFGSGKPGARHLPVTRLAPLSRCPGHSRIFIVERYFCGLGCRNSTPVDKNVDLDAKSRISLFGVSKFDTA